MLIASLRARASRARARIALAILVPVLLASCGGGGGGSTPTPPPPVSPNTSLVYGTAATGKGIAGTVSIEDAAGHVTSLPVTGDSGAFSASVDGMTAPFMLKAASSDGTTLLYSAVAGPGRANITPLTSLALMHIAAGRQLRGPSDLYAAPAAFGTWLSAGDLQTAAATMLSRLMPAFVGHLPGAAATPDSAPTFDPFGSPWTVGSAVDQLLDSYPVTFSTDGTGIVTALQTDHASGLAIDVARSDTAASVATSLSITGAGQGTIVGGSAVQFGALAQFAGGTQQAVGARWSVSGLAGASVDDNGKVSTPAVDAASTIDVTARWFDGTQASVATIAMTVLPALRPASLEITGASPNAAVAAGASLALGATVHWSDGSATTPAVTWSFTGDASAVLQLGSDGLLRAGKPAGDSPIQVTAAFSHGGIAVSALLPLTVTHFVRRVQSVTLTGLVPGQVLTAGDHADLALTALWNDGTESALAPLSWGTSPAPGAVNHILTSVSLAGRLSTTAYYVPTTSDAAARAAEADVLQVAYARGDGSVGDFAVPFSVKPLVNIPVRMEIRGVSAMTETASTAFQAWVDYADGSSASTDAAVTSQNPSLLQPTPVASVFTAAPYATKPATPLVATVAASRSYSYQDANGQPVTATLSVTHAVEVDWIDPVLTGLSVPVDHLVVGAATPVPVNGIFTKFGWNSTAPVANATLTVNSTLVTVNGNSLTATQAPATLDASWVMLTATAPDPVTGAMVTAQHVMTVALAGSVPKRLLALPWSPADADVQFRAIASDGHVDEYTVTRLPPRMLGYESPATRRRMRLFSGVTDLAQSRMNPDLPADGTQETQYVAAIEGGHVLVLRHDDLVNPDSLALPVVLPGMTTASRTALVARRDDGSGAPAAVRLYVLDQGGTVRQYKLPYTATRPLAAADVTFERQLSGSYAQISGGADFILLLSTSGGAFAEGAGESAALGDPVAGTSHWTDTFAMKVSLCASDGSACAPAPLTGATQVFANVNRSFVSKTDLVAYWGNAEAALWKSYTIPPGPDIGVTSLAAYAWVQRDGSVHYLNLAFSNEDGIGPHDIGVNNGRFLATASWLPPALEIVDGRRPASAPWPFPNLHEYQLAPTMPIVRTTADVLYYLDGRPLLDPQGNPIVLP